MAEKYTPFTKRLKSAIGLGPRDINLPLKSATPAVKRRAAAERAGSAIKTLQDAAARLRKNRAAASDTESHSYDFRKRRGGR